MKKVTKFLSSFEKRPSVISNTYFLLSIGLILFNQKVSGTLIVVVVVVVVGEGGVGPGPVGPGPGPPVGGTGGSGSGPSHPGLLYILIASFPPLDSLFEFKVKDAGLGVTHPGISPKFTVYVPGVEYIKLVNYLYI